MTDHHDPERVDHTGAARAVLQRANGLGLGNVQLRVLNAVIALTAAEGGTEAYVRLSDIAGVAYGVEQPAVWQVKKTQIALRGLAELGLIERRPPTGRPRGPSYFIALVREGVRQGAEDE